MARVDDLDLNSLLIFAAVAEAGGFTAAADRLGTSKARLSLVIARLERRLGTTLFSRTTRRVTLTEAGEALQARCVPLLREAHAVLAELAAGDIILWRQLHGPLVSINRVEGARSVGEGADFLPGF